jgi:hypothetical protein
MHPHNQSAWNSGFKPLEIAKHQDLRELTVLQSHAGVCRLPA